MYLFFDTETTGFPRKWKIPITDLNNWLKFSEPNFINFISIN